MGDIVLTDADPQPRSKKGIKRGEKWTHCKFGHPLTADNVYVNTYGNRRCKTCQRRQSKEAKRRFDDGDREWHSLSRTCQRYRLTLDQYHAMLERQDFACAICERDDVALSVDHDHATERVRGLLCQGCNLAVGVIETLRRRGLWERAEDYWFQGLFGNIMECYVGHRHH